MRSLNRQGTLSRIEWHNCKEGDMRSLHHGRLAVLMAIAIGPLAGGVAYASIPGQGGVISGC
jgi:hypothetical protein